MGERVLVGYVGVDSGSVIIVDPSYVLHSEERELDYLSPITHKQVFQGDISKPRQVSWGLAGVVYSPTYDGDGSYPVYAETENGKVLRLTIEFKE